MSIDSVILFNEREQRYYAKRTGIVVNIQKIGKNTDLIAVQEQHHKQEIRPGVWLEKSVVSFPDRNFSNLYDLSWNPNQIGLQPVINSSNRAYSLFGWMKREKYAIASINGAFFFLTDKADSRPKDLPYDFCIRNNTIIGLPSSDEPILFIQEGILQAKEVKAKGTMLIAGKTITWEGAKSKRKRNPQTAILYNSKCATIIKIRDKKTNVQIGILDNETIFTPSSPDVFDIVVVRKNSGQLVLKSINKGGGTHFYKGNFILQITGDAKNFNVGDTVTPVLLDTIQLNTISSGITIGKKVIDQYFRTGERNTNRDARSVIAKDVQGHIHLITFDGSKYIPGFRGVSAAEISPMFSRRKYKWAYFLDGGGSSRLIVREHKKLGIYANQFAFRKMPNGLFLWDWRRARNIASSISLHAINS